MEGDALETLPGVEGPFDLLFVDASKGEYARYIELAEPKLSERALMVVDNLLMSGEVALPEDAETRWNPDSLASARAPQRGAGQLGALAGLRASRRRRDRRRGAPLAEHRQAALIVELVERALHGAGDDLVGVVGVGPAAEALLQVDLRQHARPRSWPGAAPGPGGP